MNRQINLSLGAAAAGLLGAAFLPVAVAFADVPTGDDPFTLFATDVGSTSTALTEAGNLDSALYSSDPSLAATLDGDVTTSSVPPVGTGGDAPTADNAFAELLPTGASSADVDEAASYDTALYDANPTLAATLATDAASTTTTTTTGTFPDAPGTDAFTIGTTTFDPYTGGTDVTPGTEGFDPLTQGTGTPSFFETGSVADQNFEVFSAATTSTPAAELGTITTTENVTSLFGITNTGFDITGESALAGGTADLPAIGTAVDVTNFGSGFENIFTDVPGAAAGDAGTVADTFVTPFGDYDLSSLVSAFDLTALDPGAAFGLGADAGTAAVDAAGSIDPLAFLGL